MTGKNSVARGVVVAGLALSLAASPVFSTAALASTTTNGSADAVEVQSQYFSDVDNNAWYAPGVNFCSDHNIMNGYDNSTRFGVGDNLTTEQLAQLLWNIAEPVQSHTHSIKYGVNTTGKSDVKSGQWYTGAMNWAKANGVINGYGGSDRMGVGEPVTNERFVVIMANFMANGADASVDVSRLRSLYVDGDHISDWAQRAAVWANDADLLKGFDVRGARYYDSQDTVKRERAATIIYRACLNGYIDLDHSTDGSSSDEPGISIDKGITIKFDANGGTGTMADLTVGLGKSVDLTKNSFKRDGYVFKGWSLTRDGKTLAFKDGASFKRTLPLLRPITLYAVWEPVS